MNETIKEKTSYRVWKLKCLCGVIYEAPDETSPGFLSDPKWSGYLPALTHCPKCFMSSKKAEILNTVELNENEKPFFEPCGECGTWFVSTIGGYLVTGVCNECSKEDERFENYRRAKLRNVFMCPKCGKDHQGFDNYGRRCIHCGYMHYPSPINPKSGLCGWCEAQGMTPELAKEMRKKKEEEADKK